MPTISVRIPQLGEGLQEALLVEFIKQPGDYVKRDEPIYVMETDKATTDVESPYEGTLLEWTVDPGTVLEIGSEIAKMEVAEGVKEMPLGHGPPAETVSRPAAADATEKPAPRPSAPGQRRSEVAISPRTRKYLKEKGLLEVADQIPAAGSKLMPEDVDRYLESALGASTSTEEFEEVAVPKNQITLNYRMTRGVQVCVPVTVINEVDWTAITMARAQTRDSDGPTGFAMACWCIAQSLNRHERFRSVISADGRTLKVFKHVNLGIAVALHADQLVTAVVPRADTLEQKDFFREVTRQVEQARSGQDQADESTTITISNIGKAGMRIGMPAIVAPAVATLAIGEVYNQPVPDGDGIRFRKSVMATLSFDHRIVNGVGAANFMNDVKSEIESFRLSD